MKRKIAFLKAFLEDDFYPRNVSSSQNCPFVAEGFRLTCCHQRSALCWTQIRCLRPGQE